MRKPSRTTAANNPFAVIFRHYKKRTCRKRHVRFFSFIRITSRGVLQNARRVRRMAKINEAIINRAFCKTPLLAAAACPWASNATRCFLWFLSLSSDRPDIRPIRKKIPQKTFQLFILCCNPLSISWFRLNGFAPQPFITRAGTRRTDCPAPCAFSPRPAAGAACRAAQSSRPATPSVTPA